MWQLNCPPQIANTFRSDYFPRQRGTMNTPLTDMIKNFLINFDQFMSPFGPGTRPSSDMCMNEIIFLPVLRDLTSFNIRFYFLFTKTAALSSMACNVSFDKYFPFTKTAFIL